MKNSQTKGLNPFLPFGTYIPDGEPKVFGNRVWLYGSYDIFDSGYCCREYHTVSAPVDDLTDWTDHGVSFSSDAVPWSDAMLYAPDVLFRNGRYYLFFCMSDGSEGVAESADPAGPFVNARRITLDGKPVEGIDPSVLEDNGHVYYTWGQFELKIGELNDDLCTLKPETVRSGILSNADGREGFHEGSSLRKIGDKFCVIYASEYKAEYPNHGSRPTKLDYTVSDSPYGPYVRKGTVIDNDGCDPQSWNNHGSIVKIKDQWYVFYHASSNNSQFSRRARAERLDVNEDAAVISQASPSTNGFKERLLPRDITSPVNAYRFFGGAYVTQTKDGGFPAVICSEDAGFIFSPVGFKAGSYSLELAYQSPKTVTVNISAGNKNLLTAVLPSAADHTAFSFTFTAPESNEELCFRFSGASKDDPLYTDSIIIREVGE